MWNQIGFVDREEGVFRWKNPRVVNEFLELIRPERAGDPMGGLLWIRRSLVKLFEA